MCIGIPAQVCQVEPGRALCDFVDSEPQWIDIQLVEPVTSGDWLLVFLGAAREVISEQRACQIQQALQAMSAVMNGQSFDDSLFADLQGEPQLPPHLQAQFDQQTEQQGHRPEQQSHQSE
ncbi:HypC/HybG/HupF family hydrogenase formation chaperone [Oceanospirillum sediminis]|uniref:HypC/HybG/HupF family hydrogenase formation chaperone n=1 Tax=Oceanospirillum sediminis TaxID=2760088 RepID=A0A839IVK3_9GAMM|nr:HypC/HybG/HupF family hydrogenase formation chaperone [Oceanospirillum sediminis]